MLADQTTHVRNWVRRSILATFVLSGAAGLIHEMAWTRLLRLVMGNTTQSIATVLCVFMAGLAIGSYLGGRIIDKRRDPLRVFALIEATIGVYCLLLPWLIDAAAPVYRMAYGSALGSPTVITLIRFVLCVTVLLIPASLMGATLPVLTRWLVRTQDQTGNSAGRLYAFNTFGAVAGVAVAGMWLIPTVGLWHTIMTGAALNLIVAGIGLTLHHYAGTVDDLSHADAPSTTTSADPATHTKMPVMILVLLVGYGLSGMAAMVYQIAWTRVLSLMIGSSVYAFALILTAFVLGLAVGSMIHARFVDRTRDPMGNLSVIQWGIALFGLIVVPLLGMMPFFITGMISRIGDAFWRLQLAEFGIVLVVTLVPTLLMGAAFPLVTRVYADWSRGVGRSVGAVYGSNTIGAIVGSFLGGFVLIPLLGIQRTIFAAVATSVLIGCAFLLVSRFKTKPLRLTVAGGAIGLALVAMVIIPTWDAGKMSFGPYVQAVWLSRKDAQSVQALKRIADLQETIFHDEGLSATVTVKRDPLGVLTLLTNGQVEAQSRGGESQQRLLSHIPLLLHPDPQDALVIGLASGVTLDAAAEHDVKTLDCVEISQGVVEATRLFSEVNHHVLDDPRLRLIITDGRNHLALTDRKYDVIISQPSDPATAGVADLFTQEFFDNCYQRLRDRGLVCVWLKGSTVDTPVFQSIVRTFAASFDDVTIWSATGFTEYMLLGSRGKLEIDEHQLAQRLHAPSLAGDMALLKIQTVPDFLANLVTGREGAVRFSRDAVLHTDDNALLEFSAPRTVFTRKDPKPLVDALLAARDDALSLLTGDEATLARIKDQARRYFQARVMVYEAIAAHNRGRTDQAMLDLVKAGALNPRDPSLLLAVARLQRTTTELVKAGDLTQAIAVTQQIVRILPGSVEDRFNLASLLRDADQDQAALREYAKVVQLDPDHALAHVNLAKIAARLGDTRLAVEHYRQALRVEPNMIQALNNLAWIIATQGGRKLGDPREAVTLAMRACELTGHKDAAMLDTLAAAYDATGQFDQALRVSRQALALARASGDLDLVGMLQQRVTLYERMLSPDTTDQ